MSSNVLRYSSNNSGGSWWLTDDDWYNLADAGWNVEWHRDSGMNTNGSDRWLGGLASRASKEFGSLSSGIAEWESITGEHASDLGCSCCGPPHSFEYNGQYLYPDQPSSDPDFYNYL